MTEALLIVALVLVWTCVAILLAALGFFAREAWREWRR